MIHPTIFLMRWKSGYNPAVVDIHCHKSPIIAQYAVAKIQFDSSFWGYYFSLFNKKKKEEGTEQLKTDSEYRKD